MAKKIMNESLESLDVSADIQSGDRKVRLRVNVLAVVLLLASVIIGLIVLNSFGILDDLLNAFSDKKTSEVKK